MIKKLCACFLCIAIMVSGVCVCSAQVVENNAYGMSFTLSDNWVLSYTENGYNFYNNMNMNETILAEVMEYGPSYYTNVIDSSVLRDICLQAFSDDNLAQHLSAMNGVPVAIYDAADNEGYMNRNGRNFYNFSKTYVAVSEGYSPVTFYLEACVTAENGKIYIFTYETDYQTDSYGDFSNMLDSLSFESGEVKININKERIYPDSKPIIINGRTLVPIRAVAEKMGYRVDWDGANRIVTLTSGDGNTVIAFTVDKDTALKNGELFVLDVPAMIFSDRTYLPLRAVANAMDAQIEWVGEERLVEIFK